LQAVLNYKKIREKLPTCHMKFTKTDVELEQWYSYSYHRMSSAVASSVTRCPELQEKPGSKSLVWGYFGIEKKGCRAASPSTFTDTVNGKKVPERIGTSQVLCQARFWRRPL